MNKNVAGVSGKISHQCSFCNKIFERKRDLNIHTRIHTRENRFKCKICGKEYFQRFSFENHILWHSNSKPYFCSNCGEKVCAPYHIKNPARTHIGALDNDSEKKMISIPNEVELESEISNKSTCTSSTSTVNSAENNKDEKRFLCKSCKEGRSGSVQRKRTSTVDIPHRCSLCVKTFVSKEGLDSHMMTHTETKPHLCSVCGMTFKHAVTLSDHNRIHTGEKPFQCDKCGKAFAHAGTLKHHFLSHSGLKPYKCIVCGEKFRRLNSLRGHIRRHTGGQIYQCICDVCGAGFMSISHLRRHKKLHCERNYTNKNSSSLDTKIFPSNSGSSNINDNIDNPGYTKSTEMIASTGVDNPSNRNDAAGEIGCPLLVQTADSIDDAGDRGCPTLIQTADSNDVAGDKGCPTLVQTANSNDVADDKGCPTLVQTADSNDAAGDRGCPTLVQTANSNDAAGDRGCPTSVQTADSNDAAGDKGCPTLGQTADSNAQYLITVYTQQENHNSEDSSAATCVDVTESLVEKSDDGIQGNIQSESLSEIVPDYFYLDLIDTNATTENSVVNRTESIVSFIPSVSDEVPYTILPDMTAEEQQAGDVQNLCTGEQSDKSTNKGDNIPINNIQQTDGFDTSGASENSADELLKLILKNSKEKGFENIQEDTDKTHNFFESRNSHVACEGTTDIYEESNKLPMLGSNSDEPAYKTAEIYEETSGKTSLYLIHVGGQSKGSALQYTTPPKNPSSSITCTNDESADKLDIQHHKIESRKAKRTKIDKSARKKIKRKKVSASAEKLSNVKNSTKKIDHSDLKTKGSKEPFVCEFCEKQFTYKSHYNRHLRTHTREHNIEDSSCPTEPVSSISKKKGERKCNVIDQNSAKNNVKDKNTNKKTFPCKSCGKVFRSRPKCNRHMETHTEFKAYLCSVCGRSFRQEAALILHNSIHTGTKPFPCDICEKSFTRPSALKNHFLFHSDPNPYKCVVCGEKFSSSIDLKYHDRKHTGERPYQCDDCGASYMKIGPLHRHQKFHCKKNHCGNEEKSNTKKNIPPSDIFANSIYNNTLDRAFSAFFK